MSLSRVFLLFVAYSVLGWVSEVIYCSAIERRLVNRGFLKGPYCPIYGFGALSVVFLLEPFSQSVPLLFLMAILVTSLLEYATGWFLETAFKTRWWDYTRYRFNLHGRVCLLNSLLFGAMAVIGVRVIHPLLGAAVSRLPHVASEAFAATLASLMFVDLGYTLRNLSGFAERLSALSDLIAQAKGSLQAGEWFNERDLRASLEAARERFRADASEANRRFALRLEAVVERSGGIRRLLRAFPGLASREHGEELDLLRLLHQAIGRAGLIPSARVHAALRTLFLASLLGALVFLVLK